MIREVIVQMAKDTGWGYSRILGELRKLGLGKLSHQSVKNILVENGLDPGPKRGKGSWSQFLKIHAETLWQVDFFSKNVWTLQGPRQVFALAFIHVATRRVFATPATFQAGFRLDVGPGRAFLAYVDREQLRCQTLIRDRDGKYTARGPPEQAEGRRAMATHRQDGRRRLAGIRAAPRAGYVSRRAIR